MNIFQKLYYNVSYPYPNRRLTDIVSVQNRGRFFCMHKYRQTGFHDEIVDLDFKNTRVSIRHYECEKCHRYVHVYGPCDDAKIEKAIRRATNTCERR